MRHFWLLTLLISTAFLQAQSIVDSVHRLPAAVVEGDRFELLPIGTRQDSLEMDRLSAKATAGLNDLLSEQGLLYVRNYGPVGLASISIRGTSSSQSALMWNGINLQSPMNGQKDLRLIPAFFLESAAVNYGSGSALAGSGAIGGTIELSTEAENRKGWHPGLFISTGSFGQQSFGASMNYGSGTFQSSSKYFSSSADNDYEYINTTTAGNPEEQLKHAHLEQTGWQQHFSAKTAAGEFNLNYMHLRADRQLPPTIFQAKSERAQQDQTHYAQASWKNTNAKNNWQIAGGWIYESIHYQDSAFDLYSENIANSFIFQPEYSRSLANKHVLKISGYHRTDLARLDVVDEQVERHESALIASIVYSVNENWMVNANVRQGYSLNRLQPIIPSLSTSVGLSKRSTFKFQVARHYREPTLNDLYWEPGGNPDLQPENGWSGDFTFAFRPFLGDVQLSLLTTLFGSSISDQIVWQPNGSFWSPMNVEQVYSRGLEAKLGVSKKIGKVRVKLSNGLSYTRATKDEIIVEEQLAQVPIWQSNHALELRYKTYALRYHHRWVSRRYTNDNNSDFLPGFDVAQVELNGQYKVGVLRLSAFVSVKNIWGENYRIVPAYFMPPRNFNTGLQLNF